MNEIIEANDIETMIYEIRGKQVMLSNDVAKLYHVETKVLNQTIKRNINRFPHTFCFQLTNKELNEISSRSQFVTLNKSSNLRGYNIKYLPYALTEQGIMMLSGLLRSDIAVKVNIQIIDAFVAMRHYIGNDLIEQKHINKQVLKNTETIDLHSKKIDMLENIFKKFDKDILINKILFDGEMYDAYSLLLDILNEAKEEIIIIDNYAGKELLDILKKIDKKIIIISKNIDKVLKKKYESQYNNVTFVNSDKF